MPVGAIGRRGGELAPPDLPCAPGLAVGPARQRRVDGFLVNAAGAQVVPQPGIADAGRPRRDIGFGEARVRKQAGAFELGEHVADLLRGSLGGELADQFGAGMLAAGEHSQRFPFQAVAQASAATAACCSATPTAARTLFSISRAISGCSLRYSRALSLPWPMRSPL